MSEDRKFLTGDSKSRRENQQSNQSALVTLAPNVTPNEKHPEAPTWPNDRRAYLALLSGFLMMFNSWGIVNTYGTYLSFYQETLFIGRDILLSNLVGSFQSFCILIMACLCGRVLDAGWNRRLTITGSALLMAGQFSLSGVNGDGGRGQGNFVGTFLSQGFLAGLGMSCFFVTSSFVVSTWFQKKKGFAIGIVASGASIAGLVYPFMLRYLVDSLGFNRAQQCVAGLSLATCILAITLSIPNPDRPRRPLHNWRSKHNWIDVNARNDRPYAWFVASMCFMFFGFYGVFFNLEEWAAQTGVGFKGTIPPPGPNPGLRTSFLLAIMNGSSAIGRWSSSYLCDRFGAINVHSVVAFITSLLCLLLWVFAKNLSAALAFVVLFGAFSGSLIGLPPASVSAILGPNRQDRLGQWTGMMYSIAAVFALAGPAIEGHLITKYGYRFITIQLFSGLCLLLSSACMFVSALYVRHANKMQLADAQGSGDSTPARPSMAEVGARSDDEKDASGANSLLPTTTRGNSIWTTRTDDERAATEREDV